MNKSLEIEMLKKLLEIRFFEETTIKLGQQGKIGGYIHPYIGEEAVAVGVCMAITSEDYITSTHRGHGHCIAKGSDMGRMMAELFGKDTGYCKGRGGSMHITDAKLGILGANGIVGGGIPIAVGAGFTCRRLKNSRISVSFFGDGAVNNGVFHESLNMASIFKLPVIFVCENNLYANSTNVNNSTSGESIGSKGKAYNIPSYIVDGSDVIEVYNAASQAVGNARKGKGPSLIEAKTYRFYGHHSNDPAEYRDKKEEEFYKNNKDPVINFKNRLLKENVITVSQLEDIENEVKDKVNLAVKFAEESPEPDLATFLERIESI
ncbi:MAG: thiamine pyrophosphate-dependent dehydrogenase E1 component subunit alpha [Actinomycetia bacterium]|nr:thiamine pyrophosphate-dependent dehydrogenase E1 component subunit alpha [Actinomycetes bacterium]